jgi:hypothetical protein
MGKIYSKSKADCDILKIRDNRKLTENEKHNLHLCHHLAREIFKGNFSSPVHNMLTGWSARVLDMKLVNKSIQIICIYIYIFF